MRFAKRLFLFFAVNILVVMTLSVVTQVLGIRPYLTAHGIDYRALLGFCLVWGMGGAFISLALSRVMAKWMMGVRVVDPGTGDPALMELVQIVHRLARGAGLPALPEVGVYESPEINAFATGPTASRALVAVSSGLLDQLRPDELEGVLGHEISHVANGDMVTMTLLQGVINAFVMFLARAIAFAVTQGSSREESDSRPMLRYVITFALEILLSFLGAVVVAWFSRRREFRADAGGARLAGTERMIGALQALQRSLGLVDGSRPALATLKISGRPGGLLALFASHPPLEARIAALQAAR